MSPPRNDGGDTIPDILKTTVTEFMDGLPLFTERIHYLVVITGESPGKRFELAETTVLVGRHSDNFIALRDQRVSGRHCRVEQVHDRLYVTDLQSTNGTYIDGEPIAGAPHLLPPESLLQIGGTLLKHEWRPREEVEALDHMAEELRRAVSYVEALLPDPWSKGPQRTEWVFMPSTSLGGDAFGYFHLPDNRLVFYLLDVCGHGPAAAMHSVSVMTALSPKASNQLPFECPAQVLASLNARFPMERHGGMYFSMWYGVYSPKSGRLDYASAGHPPALLHTPSHSLIRLSTPAPAIGVLPDIEFTENHLPDVRTSRILLYSDGAFEFLLPDGARTTPDAFEKTVARHFAKGCGASDIALTLRNEAKDHRFDDDVSLLLLHFDQHP